jgi:SRSO17 transposase
MNLPQTLRTNPANHCRERLAEYAARYGALFARADQREWFRLYLRGLLVAPDRKNVEGIAAAVGHERQTGGNLGQALQHFVSQSPWETNRVFARYRELLPSVFRETAHSWVIHDGVLLKKGSNSVGTQRQMARPIGRKVNCQIVVSVGMKGNAGYVPLGVRLYLPKFWLRENASLVEKVVPSPFHQHLPKTSIALKMIEELRAEGWSAPHAIVDESYKTAEGLFEGLDVQDIRVVEDQSDALRKAGEKFDWLKTRLGLDHFEGRTWTGWHHHAAMVFAAAGFLMNDSCNSSEKHQDD